MHPSLSKLTRADLTLTLTLILSLFCSDFERVIYSRMSDVQYSSHTRLLAPTVVVVATTHIGFESRCLVVSLSFGRCTRWDCISGVGQA